MTSGKDDIELIRSRVHISSVISEYTQLKGRSYQMQGLCPFHNEKSPSFSVNDDKGLYYCFGCGAKGDLFDFVMQKKGLDFKEALQFLAEKAGVTLSKSGAKPSPLKAFYDINQKVSKLYQRKLFQCPDYVKEYLKDRGIDKELIKSFDLGYAPDSWDFLLKSFDKNEKNKLEKLGLIKSNSNSKTYDSYRNRVIFPIKSRTAKVLGFGGRTLSDDPKSPKYINSSESPIYSKKHVLYGLDLAIDSIQKTQTVFVVEGYFDVISMHAAGIKNVVATCGTSLTPEHVKILKKYVKKVYLLFDGDKAGKKAALRCNDIFINSGLETYVILLEEGADPDSIAREQGKNGILQYIPKAKTLFDVYLDDLISAYSNTPTSIGKISEEALHTIRKFTNPVTKEVLIKKTAEKLGVSTQSLSRLNNSKAKDSFSKPKQKVETKKVLPLNKYNELLVCILRDPNIIKDLEVELDQNKNHIPEIISEFIDFVKEGLGQQYKIARSCEFFNSIQGKLLSCGFKNSKALILEALNQQKTSSVSALEVAQDFITKLESLRLEEKIQEASESFNKAKDPNSVAQALQRKIELKRKKSQIESKK